MATQFKVAHETGLEVCQIALWDLSNFETSTQHDQNGQLKSLNKVKQRPLIIIWQGRYQDTPTLNGGESGGAVDCFDLLREQCLNNFVADCRTFSADEDPRNQFIVVQIVDLISDVYHLRLMYI